MRLGTDNEERMKLEQSPENSTASGAVVDRVGRVRALVKRELQRAWPSYLTSAPFNLLFGLLGMFLVWLYLGPDAGASLRVEGTTVFLDWIFLFALVNLPVNWTSRGYWKTQKDPFQEHLCFLKTLPVSAGEITAGRAVVMVLSTAIMVCVFFVPGYVFLADIQETLSPPQLLWFAATWASYALVCGGIYLFLEFCVRSSRVRSWSILIWMAPIAGTVLFCNLVLDVYLVAGSLALVERYGALPALISLAAGLAGFALLGAATARGVARPGKREAESTARR